MDQEAAKAPEGFESLTPLQRHTAEGFLEWASEVRRASKGSGATKAFHLIEEEVVDFSAEKTIARLLRPFWIFLDREMDREVFGR